MDHSDFDTNAVAAERPTFRHGLVDADGAPCLTIATLFTGDARGLASTAQCVLRQSLQSWEWLIASGGATSGDALVAIGESDPRIRVVDDLRTALEEARTDFVLQVLPGDFLEPTAAEKWLWFLVSHPNHSAVGSFATAGGVETPSWAGVVRRRALLSGRVAERATLPERLHWSRDTPDAPAYIAPTAHAVVSPTDPSLSRIRPDPLDSTQATSNRRLLLIVPWITTGGADKFNLDVVSQLIAREWDVTVVTTLPGGSAWAPRLLRLTPDVFILPHLLQPSEYPGFLQHVVVSRRPDAILVSNSVFAYRALPYLRRLALGIPIVDYCHSVHPDWLNGGYPRLSVERTGALDLHIVSSEHLRCWMVKRGVDRARIEVCYTNVDAELPESDDDWPSEQFSRSELGLPDAIPIIVYPCRVTVEKQPRVFAKTVLELHRQGHEYVALVVGDGPYLGWLRHFVRQHRLDERVRFLGTQPPERTRRLISLSNCLFLPSQFEGISLTLFEAMAEGVAVVAADVGGQRELVTPDCGVLVERGDEGREVSEYARVLGELLNQPEKQRAMGEAGRQRVREHFPLDAMGARMDSLLDRAGELAVTGPRAIPPQDVSRAAVGEAVRDLAFSFPGAPPAGDAPASWRLRHAVFRVLSAIGIPVYRIGIRLGAHWLEPLKDRVHYALFPRAK
jgi:glycosyltransferase involved in cell wall biosynthesis